MISFSKRFFLKCIITSSFANIGFKILNNFIPNGFGLKFIEKNFYSMGTNGRILIYSKNKLIGLHAIDMAINRINEIELSLTKFSPFSDVGKLNRNPNKFILVSEDLINVFRLGNYINLKTSGYFDMGMGNLLSSFDIDSCVPMVNNLTTLNDLNCNLVEIIDNKVKLLRNNTMIDLGGIGKGYAIDSAMEILNNFEINNAIIELGGDIKVCGGYPSGEDWKILLDPRVSFLFNDKNNIFYMSNGSISTSGCYFKKGIKINGKFMHHIIDPKSLISKFYYNLVVVIGSNSAVCDAISTACYNIYNLDNIRLNFPNYEIITYLY